MIITKNAYINQIFKITKGHISNQRKTELYGPKDYLFLDQIFYNPYTLDAYFALDLVAGEWIDKCDIDISYYPILSKMYQEKKNQTELLLLNDPITKVARFLYFEYLNNQTASFYITLSIGDLSFYLHISKKELSEVLKYFESSEILSKHNMLFNILNKEKLEKIAYQKEFKLY